MSQVKDGAWGPGYGDNPSPGHRSRAGGGDLTCVPVVAAAPPGQVDGEAAEEVEEGPGQDDDVVDVEKDDNGLGGIADTWAEAHGAGDTGQVSGSAHPCSGEGLCSPVSVLRHGVWGLGSWLAAPSRRAAPPGQAGLPPVSCCPAPLPVHSHLYAASSLILSYLTNVQG